MILVYFNKWSSIHNKDGALYVFQLHFWQKNVENILVNRILSWSGEFIHNVKNTNTFIRTMIKDMCNAFQLRKNVSVI